MSSLPSSSESMLVRHENLDQLLLLAGQVIVSSSNQELAYRSLQALRDRGDPVDEYTLETVKDLAATSSSISSSLHHLVQDIRTVTLREVTLRARRLVRDSSRKTGRRVRFEVEGEDTTVDKAIVEKLYDPISHQLRNAVDHGIEDPLTRERNGKPGEGLVRLRAYNTERETFIEIEDDGAGVDLDRLRRAAEEKGFLESGQTLDDATALEVMCAPGVTTVSSVSELSGRGVGMDVVRSQLAELGGTVSFRTAPGRGSTFTFQIPLVSAVNILDGLVVRAGAHHLAAPIGNVSGTLSVNPAEITNTLGKGRTVAYHDELLPLHNLSFLLEGAASPEDGDELPVMVLEHKEQRVALVVSEFQSPQKLVILPFDETMKIRGLAGSTALGGRRLGFILDIPALMELAFGASRVKAGGNGKALPARAERAESAAAAGPQEPIEPQDTPPSAGAASEQAAAGFAAGEAQQFLSELEKMLPDLNQAVFAIEADSSDMEQINAAFRMFHTIKGNFIMMGLPKGGETVHAVESVLDEARGGRIEITPEVIDILMDGVSYADEAVRVNQARGPVDEASPDILERAAAMLPRPDAEAGGAGSDEIVLSNESTYRASAYRRQGVPLYQVYVEFESGPQPAFLLACLIYKRVCDAGDVLGTAPALDIVEQGVMEGRFRLLLASRTAPERLEAALSSLLTSHYGATVVQLSAFS